MDTNQKRLGRQRTLALAVLLMGSGAVVAPAPVSAQCAPAQITHYSRQQFHGLMANGQSTSGQVGRAVAVGIDRSGRPLIPLGTVVWIEELGERVVTDTGHGGAGWFDVLVETTSEALRWGVQQREVCR